MKNNQNKGVKMGFIESIYDAKIVGVETKDSRIYKLKNLRKTPSHGSKEAEYFEEYMDLLSKQSIIGSKYPSFACLWEDDFLTNFFVAVDHPYAFGAENFDLSGNKNNIKKSDTVFLCDKEIDILNYEKSILKNCINSVVIIDKENDGTDRTIVDSEWRKIMKAYLEKSPFKEKIRSKKVA